MSFYYDPFANTAKNKEKKPFFAPLILKSQHEQDQNKQSQNQSSKINSLIAQKFLEKVREKIKETNNVKNNIICINQKITGLEYALDKYPELYKNNFLNETIIQEFIEKFTLIFNFLEKRVFKFRIEKFSSDFWNLLLSDISDQLQYFIQLFIISFENPINSKLSLFPWFQNLKEKHNFSLIFEKFKKHIEQYLIHMKKHQEVRISDTFGKLIRIIAKFCQFFAVEIEKIANYSTFRLSISLNSKNSDKMAFISPENRFFHSILNFVTGFLSTVSINYEKIYNLQNLSVLSFKILMLLITHFQNVISDNCIQVLLESAFSDDSIVNFFPELTINNNFDIQKFLEIFARINITNFKSEKTAQISLSFFCMFVFLYQNSSFLLKNFIRSKNEVEITQNPDFNSMIQSWALLVLSSSEFCIRFFNNHITNRFYQEILTIDVNFKEIKSYFQKRLFYFWYGVYLLKDNTSKHFYMNQMSKSGFMYKTLESEITLHLSKNAPITDIQLHIVLLANLISFDEIILNRSEILSHFKNPNLFFQLLSEEILHELDFQGTHFYENVCIEKFFMKQMSILLAFVHSCQTELGITLRSLKTNSNQITLNIEFFYDFYFAFDLKYRFKLFKNAILSGDHEDHFHYPTNVEIRRESLVEDAVEYFTNLMQNEHLAKTRIRVTFIDELGRREEGADAGGLFKDLVSELIKTLFNPSYGLLVELESNREMFINHDSKIAFGKNDLLYFKVMGFVLAKSFQMGITLDIKLSRIFLRKLKGLPNYFNELLYYDQELYKRLRDLKNNPNLEKMEITFSTSAGEFTGKDIDLIPNGSNILVNQNNVIKFIYHLANYKLNQQVERQFNAFISGFRTVIDPLHLGFFSENELQVLIYGTEEDINIDDLRAHSRYENGFSNDQAYVEEFWNVLKSFTSVEKKLFLKFVTNIERPPIFGFQNLNPSFLLYNMKSDNQEGLPSSATCGNVLFLQVYPTKDILKQKLLKAITMTSGHYMA